MASKFKTLLEMANNTNRTNSGGIVVFIKTMMVNFEDPFELCKIHNIQPNTISHIVRNELLCSDKSTTQILELLVSHPYADILWPIAILRYITRDLSWPVDITHEAWQAIAHRYCLFIIS